MSAAGKSALGYQIIGVFFAGLGLLSMSMSMRFTSESLLFLALGFLFFFSLPAMFGRKLWPVRTDEKPGLR